MDSLAAARAQMALSLGFHMIFAAVGIGMPLLMVIAEGLYLRTGRPHYRELARKWAKATGLLFAIGAVSGTALSFELGLLWPNFMEFSGAIIGPAFALEGFAFFLEAIFLGMYLYGWDRLSPRAHWLAGIPVAVTGMLSGVLVLAVNAWMQTPVGLEGGRIPTGGVDPLAVFLSPAWIPMAIHSTLSCYVAVGFAVAGVYALGILHGRNDDYHRSGLRLGMALGGVCAVLMPISGDILARMTVENQPVKLAAMEGLFETTKGAPLTIGGIPNPDTGEMYLGIQIPRLLSILAKHDPDAEIQGLKAFPRDEWPDVVLVHLSFQVMVGIGGLLVLLGLWFGWAWWRGRDSDGRRLLRALVLASPLGFVALEAGWIVSEVGRQPWTIHRVMRTAQAVTPAPEVGASLAVFTALYLLLGAVVVVLLRRLATPHPTLSPSQGERVG
ncbi:MAG: cytochrome ubiquinol oxidase subunit I [Gemmataceae bacterium]|nr:cytochrome ubiquinol oxidase subunit I [Gemmataceae bacterium]